MEFLDFSEYSDPPLLTSVTTHRALDHNRGENDMVSGMEKYILWLHQNGFEAVPWRPLVEMYVLTFDLSIHLEHSSSE